MRVRLFDMYDARHRRVQRADVTNGPAQGRPEAPRLIRLEIPGMLAAFAGDDVVGERILVDPAKRRAGRDRHLAGGEGRAVYRDRRDAIGQLVEVLPIALCVLVAAV